MAGGGAVVVMYYSDDDKRLDVLYIYKDWDGVRDEISSPKHNDVIM